MKNMLLIGLGVVLGCGGAGASTAPASEPSAHEAHEKHPHPEMPAPVRAFHDVLAPAWHAEPGSVRAKAGCDCADELAEEAEALKGASAPEGVDVAAYDEAATELEARVTELSSSCEANADDVESRLERVHTAFHAVLELTRT